MTEQRPSIIEAKALLDAICLEIDGKPASAKTTGRKPFSECASRDWWFAADKMHASTNRVRALLTSYVQIGGDRFPMTGIPLSDGYLRPDRTVMRILVDQGRVNIADGWFELTDAGRLGLRMSEDKAPEAMALEQGGEAEDVFFGGGGEGDRHRALRLWVLGNPRILMPLLADAEAETEYLLPSADRVDVLYRGAATVVALEVKSLDSNEADLSRGIFQCVKYRAVLAAMRINLNRKVSAYLVTERPLVTPLLEEACRLEIKNLVVPANWRS